MPLELFSNQAVTTLSAAITSTSATSLTVTSSTGFPAALSTVPSQFRINIDTELLIVTNVSGTTWTVVRGAEGSTAATHLISAAVTHIITQGSLGAADASWAPSDYGLIAWTVDPALCTQSAIPATAGVLQMAMIKIPYACTVTNVCLDAINAGATLTSGENFAALYSSSLVLLSATADQTTSWGTSGAKIMALTTPQAVQPGYYYVGFFFNGTTGPTFARGTTATSFVNFNLATAASRFATSTTGRTTSMPAPAGTLTAATFAWFAAVS